MGYPTFYREVKRLAANKAISTPMARAIVRKSGFHPVRGESVSVPARPRTPVDAFVDPTYGPLSWQWLVDLSGFSQIRLVQRSGTVLYLMYSEAGATSAEEDPGDWQLFTGTLLSTSTPDTPVSSSAATAGIGSDLRWIEIDAANARLLRLCLSTDAAPPPVLFASSFDTTEQGGFAVAVQAK